MSDDLQTNVDHRLTSLVGFRRPGSSVAGRHRRCLCDESLYTESSGTGPPGVRNRPTLIRQTSETQEAERFPKQKHIQKP